MQGYKVPPMSRVASDVVLIALASTVHINAIIAASDTLKQQFGLQRFFNKSMRSSLKDIISNKTIVSTVTKNSQPEA